MKAILIAAAAALAIPSIASAQAQPDPHAGHAGQHADPKTGGHDGQPAKGEKCDMPCCKDHEQHKADAGHGGPEGHKPSGESH